jgi:hypothetical protein
MGCWKMVCGMSIRMLVWECALNCVQRTIQYQEKTRYFRIDFCSDRFQLSCSIEFLLMALFCTGQLCCSEFWTWYFCPRKWLLWVGNHSGWSVWWKRKTINNCWQGWGPRKGNQPNNLNNGNTHSYVHTTDLQNTYL